MTDEEDLTELYKTDRKRFYQLIGAMGGKKKVAKGFAKFPKKKLIEAARRGGERTRQ